ncbi:MAG: hypothetical protein KC609_25480, partial [Myxococcales bacterium]|nr:hypothetical protein [Myxococcales bacterium]
RLGAPMSLVLVNIAAAALGVVLAAALAARAELLRRRLPALAFVASIAIATTLALPGAEGVHRWLGLGAVRLHAAAWLAPLILAGGLHLRSAGRTLAAVLLLVGTQAIHLAQPDAAQASALAIGWIAALAPNGRTGQRANELGLGALLVALALVTWLRPDPLTAARFSEEVLRSAWRDAPLWAALGAAALAWLVFAPSILWGRDAAAPLLAPENESSGGESTTAPDPAASRVDLSPRAWARASRVDLSPRAWARAMSAYFAAVVGASCVGAFPVPILGFGASPVLGAALGLGLFVLFAPVEGDGPRSQPSMRFRG